MSDIELGPPAKRPSLFLRQVIEWIVVIFIALTVAMLVRLFLLQQFYISGPSMETTMFSNDRVLVNKLAYEIGSIDRGDIVVFDRATMSGNQIEHDDLIKRVIGLGGETIEIRDCIVYIDGARLEESYLPSRDVELTNLSDRCGVVNMDATKIDNDEVFLIGDNRPQSFDSRMFGAIKRDLIIGQAFVIIWPPNSWSGL
ncbi:MAG: signal peptidase I [Acidimicrobiaceae bacterium]